jgi:hypothetical protein
MAKLEELIQRTKLFLKDRKIAYSLSFSQPAGQIVLGDLIKWSRWIDGPRDGLNEAQTQRILGRQDVIRRINQHMNLTTDQLYALYNGQQVPGLVQQSHGEEDE